MTNLNEPLLTPTLDRLVVFPIHHEDLWKMYQDSLAAFWTAEEIDFSDDLKDWEKLTDNERHFLKHILAFFAASDGIVNENLATNFYNEVQYPEARMFYSVQIIIEAIHAHTYSLTIDTYVKDPQERADLFNGINTVPFVGRKAEWAMKWLDSSRPFAERLLAFACVEGILFSTSFCAIYWFKKRGLLPGLVFSNEKISSDEASHADFAVLLHNNHIENKVEPSRILEIVSEAVELERYFVRDALPVELIGMNSDLMCQYLEFVADRLLTELGCPKHYNASNPFPFMEQISLQPKTNFFEARVGQYRKFGVDESPTAAKFDLSSEF